MKNDDTCVLEDLGTATEETKGMVFGNWDGGWGYNLW